MKQTREQTALIEAMAAGENIIGEACAGSGKTTCILAGIAGINQRAKKKKLKNKLLIAFNVRIRDELIRRLNDPTWTILTFNGLGLRMLYANSKSFGGSNFIIDGGKNLRLARNLLEREPKVDKALERHLTKCSPYERADFLASSLAVMKTYGFTQAMLTGENVRSIVEMANEKSESRVTLRDASAKALSDVAAIFKGVLHDNLVVARTQRIIDFDDQIYLAALHCPNPGKRWDVVVVDEFQDASSLNMTMLNRCLMPESQVVVVGDRFQSLYQFRAASGTALDDAPKAFKRDFTRLTLSTTFRCSRVVSARQPKIVKIKRFVPAKHNADGDVHLPFWSAGTRSGVHWNYAGLKERVDLIDESKPRAAALARTNAELLMGLVLYGKEKPKDKFASVAYAGRVPSEAQCNFAASRMMQLPHRKAGLSRVTPTFVDGLALFMFHLNLKPAEAASLLKELSERVDKKTGYAANSWLTFSTVHQSKGLEWDAVFLIEPFASMPLTGNVRYVAETRTKDFLAGATLAHHELCTGNLLLDVRAFTPALGKEKAKKGPRGFSTGVAHVMQASALPAGVTCLPFSKHKRGDSPMQRHRQQVAILKRADK